MRKFGWTEFSEKLNGRLAMLGMVSMIVSYLLTGKIIPWVW
jgi:hypothetical protein